MNDGSWHVHFGAGRLSIGAVLPCLNPIVRIAVVVLARPKPQEVDAEWLDWNTLCVEHAKVRLKNTADSMAPFSKQFVCLRRLAKDKEFDPRTVEERNVLIVADKWDQVIPLLMVAASASVSLGEQQRTIEDTLLECPRKEQVPLLAFENSVTLKRSALLKAGWAVHHVVTDRICSKRTDGTSGQVVVQCEDYLMVLAAKELMEFLNPQLPWDPSRGTGIRFVQSSNIPFYVSRKRALVNSIHKILALFCAQALRGRRVPAQGLLPVVQALIDKEPGLPRALEVYARLQAIRLCWPVFDSTAATVNQTMSALNEWYGYTHPQLLFDKMYSEVVSFRARFEAQPDELSRLVNPKNFRKEVLNWREHIFEPVEFVEQRESAIKSVQLYDKPSCLEMKALRGVLGNAFSASAS